LLADASSRARSCCRGASPLVAQSALQLAAALRRKRSCGPATSAIAVNRWIVAIGLVRSEGPRSRKHSSARGARPRDSGLSSSAAIHLCRERSRIVSEAVVSRIDVAAPRPIQQSTDASEAAALVLVIQEFVANGGGRPWSAPPQCCIRDGRAAVAVSVGVAGGVPRGAASDSALGLSETAVRSPQRQRRRARGGLLHRDREAGVS
jgi:hypothetical protein